MKLKRRVTRNSQTGVVLVVSLIILLLLTLIGVTGMQVSGLEEKMTGNVYDQNLAFQAAEAALRDAERDIQGYVKAGTTPRQHADCNYNGTSRDCKLYEISQPDCGAGTVSDLTDDGICEYAAGKTPWKPDTIMTTAPSIEYGAFTGESALTGNISAQPRYLIERIKQQVAGQSDPFYYRITARGQGANANTVVVLQEVYK